MKLKKAGLLLVLEFKEQSNIEGSPRQPESESAGLTAAEKKTTRKECGLLLSSLSPVILSQVENGSTQSGYVFLPQSTYAIPQRCSLAQLHVGSWFFQVLHLTQHPETTCKISQDATATEGIVGCCIPTHIGKKV